MILAGIPEPLSLSVPTLLTAIYAWLSEGLDSKGLKDLDAELTRPRPGTARKPSGDWSDEALALQFNAARVST
jgi:hypothetical protein